MTNATTICDHCKADLTTTTNCEDYRLLLVAERIPSGCPIVTLMAVEPPVRQHHHFCGIECLRSWVSAKWPGDVASHPRARPGSGGEELAS